MREYKFRYVYQYNKKIIFEYFTLDDIEKGYTNEDNNLLQWDFLLSRDQYTGLKDKNGTDIYEGDIVQVFTENMSHAVIVYAGGNNCYQWLHGNNKGGKSVMYVLSQTEIIGNIHENPNLLDK